MKLSKRLELLAYLVEKHKKGNILADIGTDHAYLPCYLIERNIIEKAYACDVAKGPFAASLSTIRQYHFEENVEALLGDGLDPILDKEVDMVTIAGMGSFLIVEILEKVEGNKIIYEVDIQYSQEDMMFGPVIRKNKNELFIRYWQKQYQTYLKIMNDLPSNHPRYLELENQKHLIEGELNESL